MASKTLSEKEGLALRVVDLAKAQALADNHFLAAAMGRLKPAPARLDAPFSTDGSLLAFDSEKLLALYVAQKEAPKHDLMHSVLHCVFVHPYVGSSIDREMWNLAADIVAERNVSEVCGWRADSRGMRIAKALRVIESEMGGRPSAEKLYKALKEGMWAGSVKDWAKLFRSDDHAPWYSAGISFYDDEGEQANEGRGAETSGRSRGRGEGNSDFEGDFSGSKRRETEDGASGGGNARSAEGGASGLDPSRSGVDGKEPESKERTQGKDAGASSDAYRSQVPGMALREARLADRSAEQEEWRRVAKALAVNLQTYSKARGKALGGMLGEIEDANRRRVDYSDFLRQFAIPGEVLRVSDDEFDYVFYTYGLKLYGNLPLIEPLEYREEKRIREFVIVIDTSGSVWGQMVRRFIDVTFDILKSTEAFFERVHVRIIQCDASVHSDDVITNLAELKEWSRAMYLRGGGGTDFRPAFAYVDGLIEDGQFENLGGLIYFTDGYGDYPQWMPDYKTAFVFYDDDYRPECVPPWAAQIVLDDSTIEGNSGIR